MKDELWCISAPAAAKSLTAPAQEAPWPSLQEGPPTGQYGAHTGSRTTSALRKNSAHPAGDSCRGGVNEREMSKVYIYYDKGIGNGKNRNEKQRK